MSFLDDLQRQAIVKDFLPDIQKIEPRLHQSGAQVDANGSTSWRAG